MSRRRVVVTGLGCVSPVGNTVADAWSNVLAGKSGIDLITRFDASSFSCKIAGEVRNFDLDSYISPKEARTMDSFIHYGIAAAMQAYPELHHLKIEDGPGRRLGRSFRVKLWPTLVLIKDGQELERLVRPTVSGDIAAALARLAAA